MTRATLRDLLMAATVAGGATTLATHAHEPSPQQATFRAQVDLVRVDLSVRDGGRRIAGLSKEDFEILDNGVRQSVERVVTERIPLEAWLVLDVSSSLQGKPLVQLQSAAAAFVAALDPDDSAGLVTFSHAVVVPQPPTRDLAALRAALGRLRADGATALYDATYVALTLRHPGDTRGVAVVLTDGADNVSWLTGERVLEAAEHSDVVAYGIGVLEKAPAPRIRNPMREPEPAPPDFADSPQYRFLSGLAGVTGGRLFDASFATLRETFARVLDDIRARYLLTYYPSQPSRGWHVLEVKLSRGRGRVTARRGYWIGDGAGPPDARKDRPR